jgi:hypothetical protein
MWFWQILVLVLFLFIVFGFVCLLLGYNDELNFEPDDQDMLYPMLVASTFGILFPGMGFLLEKDSKLSLIITFLIFIFCAVFLLFFKKDKGSQDIINGKKARNDKYKNKLKQLTNGGWLIGDILNYSYGKSQIIISPFGKKTKLYKLSLESKFDSYQMIKFKKSNWISFATKSLEHEYGMGFDETVLFESFFVVVPKLVKGANIYYDYGDGLFHKEFDQKVFMGNFETSNNCNVEVRNGKIVKIEKNIWLPKSKNII